MKDERLKACPFCGNEAQVRRLPMVHKEAYAVGCGDERCFAAFGINMLTFTSEDKAITAWNTRKTEPTEEPLVKTDKETITITMKK